MARERVKRWSEMKFFFFLSFAVMAGKDMVGRSVDTTSENLTNKESALPYFSMLSCQLPATLVPTESPALSLLSAYVYIHTQYPTF